MRDMRRLVAVVCLIAFRGAVALPAPNVASCDRIGPKNDCGEYTIISTVQNVLPYTPCDDYEEGLRLPCMVSVSTNSPSYAESGLHCFGELSINSLVEYVAREPPTCTLAQKCRAL